MIAVEQILIDFLINWILHHLTEKSNRLCAMYIQIISQHAAINNGFARCITCSSAALRESGVAYLPFHWRCLQYTDECNFPAQQELCGNRLMLTSSWSWPWSSETNWFVCFLGCTIWVHHVFAIKDFLHAFWSQTAGPNCDVLTGNHVVMYHDIYPHCHLVSGTAWDFVVVGIIIIHCGLAVFLVLNKSLTFNQM